ncbi:hypothetical protein ACSBOB_20185 [Mesorhizobium sp. ASY16-5R]|uniref:hypothetical protein n=1 Tax=Mesorhizobium sp. ASY16-5R TaxID=3445772 RepID=UPI003FA0FE26
MTDYDTLRVKVGRRPITVVELDLDFCTRTYGVAPCTAAVGVTGPQKCFNTFATCQDSANYSKGSKTYKFTEPNPMLPFGENYFPCITGIDIAPTQLKPGSFSVSAAVTVTIQDFPHHDRGVDPYVSGRSYTPRDQGTFFGKLMARNPVVANRVMRVNTGYIDADRTVYTLTRTYFIDRIEGPDANGRVKVVGKDLLRFAEIEKTMMPRPATAVLASASPGVSNFTRGLSPTGVGADYPTSGIGRLDDEMVEYTRSGDNITTIQRGVESSGNPAHNAATKFQECFPSSAVGYRPVEIIRDLLLAAGIDSAFIPYSAWVTECDAYIDPLSVETFVADPESVKTLIEEILTDFGCALWWDELDAELKFKVISSGATASVTLSDNEHILEGSMSVKVLEKERFSRVQLSFGVMKKGALQNYASRLTPDLENTGKSLLVIDTVSENPNAFDGAVSKNIVSRWLGYNRDIEAQSITDRYLARYNVALREVTFKLDAKDSDTRTGDVIEIKSRMLQAPDGSQVPVKFLVTQFRELIVGSQYQYTALELPN